MVIVFAGDSITDAGRALSPPLGSGYVRLVADAMADRGTTFVNSGVNGSTMSGVEARWADDVLRHEPDVLVLLIGINDVHVQAATGDAVDCIEYEGAYRRVLSRLCPAPGPQLVLCDPFYLPAHGVPAATQRRMVEGTAALGCVVRAIASEVGSTHVPLNDLFHAALADSPPAALLPDGVHPTPRGTRLIADAVLDGLVATLG